MLDFMVSGTVSQYDKSRYVPIVRGVMEFLTDLYEVTAMVQIKNTKRTYHLAEFDGSHKFVYGIKTLNWHYEGGIHEYANVEYLLPYPKPRRMHAILFVLLHEFSHAIISNTYGVHYRRKGIKPHGRHFQATYNELITLFEARDHLGAWRAFI